MARKAFDDCMHAAGETPQKSACIISDLQKTLPTPQLQTNKVFYLRQMRTYNLNIHDTAAGKGNMWDEQIASRGSQEIASCLIIFCTNLPTWSQL